MCRGSPSCSRYAWSLPSMHLLHCQRRTEWRSFPSIGASPKRCNQKSAEFCSSRYQTTCRAQRSFYPRQRGPGFLRPPSQVTMNMSLPGATPERTNDVYSTVLEPVRGLPGVQAAGVVDTLCSIWERSAISACGVLKGDLPSPGNAGLLCCGAVDCGSWRLFSSHGSKVATRPLFFGAGRSTFSACRNHR